MSDTFENKSENMVPYWCYIVYQIQSFSELGLDAMCRQ